MLDKIRRFFTPDGNEVPAIDMRDLVRVDIVGEASYQSELGRLAPGRKTENGVSIWKRATLSPEPDNPVDANAVMVEIDGYCVGYLDRRQAVVYHQIVAEAGRPGEAMSDITAEIRGGRVGQSFGVALYMAPTIASRLNPTPRPRRQRVEGDT